MCPGRNFYKRFPSEKYSGFQKEESVFTFSNPALRGNASLNEEYSKWVQVGSCRNSHCIILSNTCTKKQAKIRKKESRNQGGVCNMEKKKRTEIEWGIKLYDHDLKWGM